MEKKGWLDRKASGLVHRTIGKWIHEDKFLIVRNELSFEEREKVVDFSEKFMLRALYISTFISVMLIMFYFYGRLGVEKMVALLLTLIFIQLIYINKKLDKDESNKK